MSFVIVEDSMNTNPFQSYRRKASRYRYNTSNLFLFFFFFFFFLIIITDKKNLHFIKLFLCFGLSFISGVNVEECVEFYP